MFNKSLSNSSTNGLMQKVSLLLTCNVCVCLFVCFFWIFGRLAAIAASEWVRQMFWRWGGFLPRLVSCGPALAAPVKAYSGPGEGQFLLEDVYCTGREGFLGQCPHADWYIRNCGPAEDASVICSGNSHLSLQGCTSHHPDSVSTNPTSRACACVQCCWKCVCARVWVFHHIFFVSFFFPL